MTKLTRYWIEFSFKDNFAAPAGTAIGCGITAYDYDDAIFMLQEKVFAGHDLPSIKRAIEDVDISTLDQGHVIPNMKPPIYRGVWFPLGYD